MRKEVWVRVNVEEGAGRKTLGVEVPNREFWKTGSARGVVVSADSERLSVFFFRKRKVLGKVPFRVAKIGSKRLPVPQSGSDLYRKNDYTQ